MRVDLAPVTLGSGTRMLEGLTDDPCGFGDPQVIQGIGVTHLIYPIG